MAVFGSTRQRTQGNDQVASWGTKMSRNPRFLRRYPSYPPQGTRPVHQGDAMPTVYPARTVQSAKVIGRRWSRWTVGAIGVRSHRPFRPDESRNAMRTVPPRPAEPPRKGHFAAFSGGGNIHFCIFLDPSADAASFCPTWWTFGQKLFFAQTQMSSRSSSTEVD